MIKFLLLGLVYGFIGTLKTDEPRSINLNYTSGIESLIIKFTTPSSMVCVVSPADLQNL